MRALPIREPVAQFEETKQLAKFLKNLGGMLIWKGESSASRAGSRRRFVLRAAQEHRWSQIGHNRM